MRFAWILFLVLMVSYSSAIVIIPPTIYFVTLSLATFISNMIIGLVAWIALSGLVGKKFFGKKLSQLFSHLFSAIKKIMIAVVSMLLAVFIVNPIEIFSILLGAGLAAIICGFLLFLSDYSKFRIVQGKQQRAILKSTAVFSAIVLLLFSVSVYSSLEIKILTQGEPSQGFYEKVAGHPLPIPSLTSQIEEKSFGVPTAREKTPRDTAIEAEEPAIEKKDEIIVNELWFYPTSSEDCLVRIGEHSFDFKPQNNCYFLENNIPVRIFCPLKVSVNEIAQQGTVEVIASGSCQENFTVTIVNGFKVEST